MNNTTRKSRATSNTSNSNFNANIIKLIEASRSEEEEIVMCKHKRKINVKIINENVKGISSEAEGIKIRKCSRKSHVDIINEEMKGRSSEEEKIGIRMCRRGIRVDIINEEVKNLNPYQHNKKLLQNQQRLNRRSVYNRRQKIKNSSPMMG